MLVFNGVFTLEDTVDYQYTEVRNLEALKKAKKQLLHFLTQYSSFLPSTEAFCKKWPLWILNLHYEVQSVYIA